MTMKKGTIALVADGSRLLLLRNDGDAFKPALHVLDQRAIPSLSNRERSSDAPGVFTAAAGVGRSTYDDHDPHQRAEEEFAAEAASLLSAAAESHRGDLIVIAPPRTLGVIRQHYSDQVKARIVAEIDKDLTKHPTEEIARLMASYL